LTGTIISILATKNIANLKYSNFYIACDITQSMMTLSHKLLCYQKKHLKPRLLF